MLLMRHKLPLHQYEKISPEDLSVKQHVVLQSCNLWLPLQKSYVDRCFFPILLMSINWKLNQMVFSEKKNHGKDKEKLTFSNLMTASKKSIHTKTY